jgi:hypothetical protein
VGVSPADLRAAEAAKTAGKMPAPPQPARHVFAVIRLPNIQILAGNPKSQRKFTDYTR